MEPSQAPLLELPRYLDQAESKFLLDGIAEFVFPVRKRAGIADFYERLDRELREQSVVRIHSFREIKEGFTRVSRPAELVLTLEALLHVRPYLSICRGEIEELARAFEIVDLLAFLRSDGREGLKDLALLRACLEVLSYLATHKDEVVGLLPRQLPHGQSTKLIGRETLFLRLFSFWRGESATWRDFYSYFALLDKPLEFRFFAPGCRCQGQRLARFHGLLAAEWAHDYDFASSTGTLIVENFESFLALASLSKSTLLMWGAGWRAVHLRSFVERLPKPRFYWGDIDKEGYEIFGQLKSFCPELAPLMMGMRTIEHYRHLQQRKEIFLGPFRNVDGLQREYEFVSRHGIQIEQEQLRDEWPFGTNLV